MKKLFSVIIGLGLLAMIVALMPAVTFSQSEVVCEQDVIVQAEDTLSSIANKVYGNVLAFPAIAEATNSKAASDKSYATIDDVNVLETGWKLCLPSAEVAQELLGEVSTAPAVDSTVDTVQFPAGYQDSFQIFYEFDRPQNGSARVIYANEVAASVSSNQIFPYGSVLAMEVYRTKKDEAGQVLLDENGRFVRDELSGVFVMRKEPGLGTRYGDQRNGEWEYAAYRPDGEVFVTPQDSQACAACHVEAGSGKDWVFGIHRFLGPSEVEPAENEVNVVDYQFVPNTLTVPVGTEVKWLGNDVIFHSITAIDGSFSGALRPSGSFSHKFEQPGTFEYFSAFYPDVKGTIIVE